MPFTPYLRSTEFIDHTHPAIIAKADELTQGCHTDIA